MTEPTDLHPNWWARAFVREVYRRLFDKTTSSEERSTDVADHEAR